MPRKSSRSVTELTVCGVLGAVLCVLCPFTVPVGVIPFSLATFAVCCIGGAAGFKRGLTAVGLYLLIGAVGLPVFAGFRGGVSTFASPTGGFLLGYIPLVVAAGLVSDKSESKAALCAAFCGGSVLLYLLASVWVSVTTRVPFFTAVLTSVAPFLPFDAVKIAAATVLSPKLKKRLQTIQ